MNFSCFSLTIYSPYFVVRLFTKLILIYLHCFQQDFWFNKTKVKVVAVAPYYIDTPLLTNEEATFADAMEDFKKSVSDNPVLE